LCNPVRRCQFRHDSVPLQGIAQLVVSERRESDGPSEDVEDRVARDLAPFRIYDLRSTYATRLSAGGVADEWVTQLLRQGDAKVSKKYSQMKLQMKRRMKAGQVLTRRRSTEGVLSRFCHGRSDFGPVWAAGRYRRYRKWFKIKEAQNVGA